RNNRSESHRSRRACLCGWDGNEFRRISSRPPCRAEWLGALLRKYPSRRREWLSVPERGAAEPESCGSFPKRQQRRPRDRQWSNSPDRSTRSARIACPAKRSASRPRQARPVASRSEQAISQAGKRSDNARQPAPSPTSQLHCPASVAITFQLGSRQEISPAKVQTSVTSVTFSALPSITAPPRSRVAEISFETKRTVICAVVRLRSSAAVIVEPSIETKRVSAVSLRRSRSVMAASNPSKTSFDKRLRSWRRSPAANAVTIIS